MTVTIVDDDGTEGTEASNWKRFVRTLKNIFYAGRAATGSDAWLDCKSFIFQRTEFLLQRLVRLREAINKSCKLSWEKRASSSCVVLQRQSAVTSHLSVLFHLRLRSLSLFLKLPDPLDAAKKTTKENRRLVSSSETSGSSRRSSWSPFTGGVNMQHQRSESLWRPDLSQMLRFHEFISVLMIQLCLN